MSDATHAAHEGGHDAHAFHVEAEPDRSNARGLVFFVAALTAFHFGALVSLWVFFVREAETIVQAQNLGKTSKELSSLRKSEQTALTTYGVVDAKAGVYRVPIEKGIELYLADVKAAGSGPVRVAAPAAPPPAPEAPAPAPAPAPTGGSK